MSRACAVLFALYFGSLVANLEAQSIDFAAYSTNNEQLGFTTNYIVTGIQPGNDSIIWTIQQSDDDCVSGVRDGNGGDITQSIPGGFIITANVHYPGNSGGGLAYWAAPITKNFTIGPPVQTSVLGGGVSNDYGNPNTPPSTGTTNNEPGCYIAFVFMSNGKNIGPAFYPQAAESVTNRTFDGQAVADTSFDNPPAMSDPRFYFGLHQQGYSAIFDYKWYGQPIGTGGLTYTGKFDDYVQKNQLTWSTWCGMKKSAVSGGTRFTSQGTHNPNQWNTTPQ